MSKRYGDIFGASVNIGMFENISCYDWNEYSPPVNEEQGHRA